MTISAGRLEVETSDHVVLRYDLVGLGNRIFAALIDVVIIAVIGYAAVIVLGRLIFDRLLHGLPPPVYSGVAVLVTFFFIWSYFVVLEWLWQGQTVGKRLYGLRVIGEDGAPPRFTAALVRNVVRLADWLPLMYVLGMVSIVVSPRSQRLGDLAAGTYVVRAPKPRIDFASLRTIEASTAATPAADAVAARRLSGEAQRLVREFMARQARLEPADRRRVAAGIAAALRPLVPDITASDDVEFIRAVARSMRAAGGER